MKNEQVFLEKETIKAYIKENKKNSGVTLIALIVTIIVLLILAGITVISVTGQNGLINQAEEAKTMGNNNSIKEQIEIAVLNAMSNKKSKIDETLLKSWLTKSFGPEGTGFNLSKDEIENNKIRYVITVSQQKYTIDEDGEVTEKEPTLNIVDLAWVDEDGNVISGKLLSNTTSYIRFRVEDGTDIVVKDSSETTIELVDGYYKKSITENGDYTFTVTGKVEGKNATKTVSKSISDYFTIPAGLTIGSIVKYEPTGTYNWNAEYATSYTSGTADYTNASKTLQTVKTGSSVTSGNQDMSVRSWRVLSIDENTGKVQLVPQITNSNTVELQGPQGYNNSVKLLNDACYNLYSTQNSSGVDIISARSINIEDYEGENGTAKGRTLLDATITDDKANYTSGGGVKYGETYSTEYTYSGKQKRNFNGEYIESKTYPVIYEREESSRINETVTVAEGKEVDLGLSSQMQLIERNEGTTSNPYGGAKTATVGIRPKQTAYKLGENYTAFSEKFKEYASGKSYADLLLPSGKDTNYWIASRCVELNNSMCGFIIRYVYGGLFGKDQITDSRCAIYTGAGHPLFPIVSLSSELITKVENVEDTFQVNI